MKKSKKIVLVVAGLALFVPSFQRSAKADVGMTVTAYAVEIYLMIDGIGEGGNGPRIPAPPPPPPPRHA
ncbi:MAG TPA: hypothetical protein VHW46_13330 [Terracidiphilus sp.]|nr:hypothetical protein [Terracidiphilus sp.]